jgi:lipid-A-disaccharide synthase-like uncharacterized protein
MPTPSSPTTILLSLIMMILGGGADAALADSGQKDQSSASIEIKGWGENISLLEQEDGILVYRLERPDGSLETLTPLQFAKRHFQREQNRDFINRLFNITSPIGIAWVLVGLLGQALFTGRMVVQWMVSERRGRSTVPVIFWWLSLMGASMLLVYFIWRKDIVGILGQGLGWFIYLRNLSLIYGRRGNDQSMPGLKDDPDPEPSLEGETS